MIERNPVDVGVRPSSASTGPGRSPSAGDMPTRPRQPNAGRSSHQRGYGAQHRAATAVAIHREPWCHTLNGCPHPDAGTPANPLTGGHPHTLAEFAYDTTAWAAQALQAQCSRCNSARLPLLPTR